MERETLTPLRRSERLPSRSFRVPPLEHRELRYFVAVAEELHFTRAAGRLAIAQPPLSVAIAQLEAKLGTRLFERDSRHVKLTPAGTALLRRARPILRQLEDAVAVTRDARSGGAAAVVRVAADVVATFSALPALVLALERAEEGLEVESEQRIPAEIVGGLLAGDVDVGLLVARDAHPGLAMQRVRRAAPVALFERSHPLARRKRVRLAELAEHRLALWPEEQAPDTHGLVLSLFDGLALEGGTVTIPMHSGAWAEELAAGSFCVVPADAPRVADYTAAAIADATATFDTQLAWNEATPPPFLDEIRDAATGLGQS
jgi:DNA-binding transcriptional LysR family regulator